MKTNLSDVYTVVIERGVTRCNEIACTEHMGEELWQTAKDEIIPQLEEISSDYQIPLMIITKMALKKITTIMVELEELERITKGSENDLGIDIREQFIKVKSSLIRIEQASISNTHIVRHQWVAQGSRFEER